MYNSTIDIHIMHSSSLQYIIVIHVTNWLVSSCIGRHIQSTLFNSFSTLNSFAVNRI